MVSAEKPAEKSMEKSTKVGDDMTEKGGAAKLGEEWEGSCFICQQKGHNDTNCLGRKEFLNAMKSYHGDKLNFHESTECI